MSLLSRASLVQIPSGYKEDTLYSQLPNTTDGDFTFTRASTGTRVNADGYIEEVPWNILTYSEDFTTWQSFTATATSNQAASPIGDTTADLVSESSQNNPHFIYKALANQINSIYTFSCYAKQGTNRYAFCQIMTNNALSKYGFIFDLQDGVVTETNQKGTISDFSYSTTALNDGWYRFSLTLAHINGLGVFSIIGLSNSANPTYDSSEYPTYQGNTSNNIYVWGAQLVKGNAPKPYIKTTDRLDIPRLDYSGGATCPTLLLEPQRTNYVPDSESWTGFSGTGVTKYANQTDINGGSQAMRIVYASGVVGYPGFNLGGTRNGKASIYIKSNTSNTYNMRMSSNTSAAQNITVTPTWQRITVDAVNWTIMSLDNYDNGVWAAADISTCFWQTEEGSFPTSYIPTSGTSVTRTDETFEADSLGSIIGQTEGCIFIDFVYNEGNRFYIYDDGATADGFLIYRSGTTYNLQVGNGGSYWAITNMITGLTKGTRYKLAINYKLNNYKVYVNGSQTATNTSIEVPTTNKIISSQLGGSNKFTNNINKFVLFSEKLTDTELAEITTI